MSPEEEDESDNDSLWKIAWDGFRRGFTLTYFARAGNALHNQLFNPSSSGDTQQCHFKNWKFVSLLVCSWNTGSYFGSWLPCPSLLQYLHNNVHMLSIFHSMPMEALGVVSMQMWLSLISWAPIRHSEHELNKWGASAQVWDSAQGSCSCWDREIGRSWRAGRSFQSLVLPTGEFLTRRDAWDSCYEALMKISWA